MSVACTATQSTFRLAPRFRFLSFRAAPSRRQSLSPGPIISIPKHFRPSPAATVHASGEQVDFEETPPHRPGNFPPPSQTTASSAQTAREETVVAGRGGVLVDAFTPAALQHLSAEELAENDLLFDRELAELDYIKRVGRCEC